MSSSLRRGALAASALVFSIATLAACGAGNDSQTLEIKPDNAATSVGDIKLQNVFNNGSEPQTLDSVTVDGVEGAAEIKPAKGGGKLTVPAGGSVVIGGKDNATVSIPHSGEAMQDGNAQKVTFTFSETGEINLRAFVVPAEHYFAEWGPSDVPSAPAESGSESPSAGESASETPAGEGAEGEGGTAEDSNEDNPA